MNDTNLYLVVFLCIVTFCTTLCCIRILSNRTEREVTRIDSELRSIKKHLAAIRISRLSQEKTRLLREGKHKEVKYVDDRIKQELNHLNEE